jgi:hypothetical protein
MVFEGLDATAVLFCPDGLEACIKDNVERIPESSLRLKSRMAGAFYLLTFLTGIPAIFASKLIVSGDAAATATNVLAHEPLFWLGLASELMVLGCYIVVTALFYELFKVVNRTLALTAAFFSLVGCAIQAFSSAFYLAPLILLNGTQSLTVFSRGQLEALGFLLLKLHAPAYNLGLFFFGVYCLLTGYLILKSTFLPRLLGILMSLAGLSWLVFLAPPLAHYLDPYIRISGIIGELSLTLWLLVIGVNHQRWQDQAAR